MEYKRIFYMYKTNFEFEDIDVQYMINKNYKKVKQFSEEFWEKKVPINQINRCKELASIDRYVLLKSYPHETLMNFLEDFYVNNYTLHDLGNKYNLSIFGVSKVLGLDLNSDLDSDIDSLGKIIRRYICELSKRASIGDYDAIINIHKEIDLKENSSYIEKAKYFNKKIFELTKNLDKL